MKFLTLLLLLVVCSSSAFADLKDLSGKWHGNTIYDDRIDKFPCTDRNIGLQVVERQLTISFDPAVTCGGLTIFLPTYLTFDLDSDGNVLYGGKIVGYYADFDSSFFAQTEGFYIVMSLTNGHLNYSEIRDYGYQFYLKSDLLRQ